MKAKTSFSSQLMTLALRRPCAENSVEHGGVDICKINTYLLKFYIQKFNGFINYQLIDHINLDTLLVIISHKNPNLIIKMCL